MYYPLLNNQDIISAQVIWTSLSSGLFQLSLYEVNIFTADADKLHIEVIIALQVSIPYAMKVTAI